MATDANVCPYPAGDSTLARMALEAAELGFDSIVTIGGRDLNPVRSRSSGAS
ncbi:MAG: hypothetical protein RQM90_03055 [Methanoculleus sp.]